MQVFPFWLETVNLHGDEIKNIFCMMSSNYGGIIYAAKILFANEFENKEKSNLVTVYILFFFSYSLNFFYTIKIYKEKKNHQSNYREVQLILIKETPQEKLECRQETSK